jgi:hypothetical protein
MMTSVFDAALPAIQFVRTSIVPHGQCAHRKRLVPEEQDRYWETGMAPFFQRPSAAESLYARRHIGTRLLLNERIGDDA